MDRSSMPGGGNSQAPWMRNERWSSGVIRDQSAENIFVVWIVTLAWNVVTVLALIADVKNGIHGRDPWRLVALVFTASALSLFVWAARRTRRISKFGASVFRLSTLPAAPGGELAGSVHVARTFRPRSAIKLKLRCINRFVAGVGRNSRVIDRVVWQDEQTLDGLSPCPEGADIPVTFQIPPDAPPSSDQYMRDGVRWQLEARCKTGGVGYFSRFEVPVFAVAPAEFVAARRRDPVFPSGGVEAAVSGSGLSEPGIVFERTGGRLRIHFAAARDRSSVALTTVIGLVLTAIAIGLAAWPDARMDGFTKIYFLSVIIPLGGIFDVLAAFNWLVTDEIAVRYGSLTVERRAPLYRRQRTFKTGQISEVFCRIGANVPPGSASATDKRKKFHSLMLKTRDGELIWLAEDIIQKEYATWLAEEIKGALGMAARSS